MLYAHEGIDGEQPRPISFRTVRYQGGSGFPAKRQVWGELNYALQGIAQINIEGVRFLSPPQYAIWIPPGFEHDAINPQDVLYVTTHIEAGLCADLPQQPCTLDLSALLKAILADFARRGIRHPRTPDDLRLAMVIVDQVRAAPRFAQYLPTTDDILLGPMLSQLQQEPGDKRSAAEWANRAGTTERTLSRRCQEVLGMSFNDWRQRLRLLTALALLDEGESVHGVAERLGYSNPSAFIAMFRRLTGVSPSQMRKRQ
ncbi:AraC family transcriptional regulator [Rhizobium sp. SL42]|uniref:AraC family transcriptional regulator n=1 Tax=Rhizobium sp. SL42 TaxID=2806346 RepID=UPI001F29BC97|nr:helix-turn-helix transcriptional regulator [Rhizobium sp. SL42]UJW76589.1 helix-turn-helix transcriptional regulator [Rhizobium sp. SL42]